MFLFLCSPFVGGYTLCDTHMYRLPSDAVCVAAKKSDKSCDLLFCTFIFLYLHPLDAWNKTTLPAILAIPPTNTVYFYMWTHINFFLFCCLYGVRFLHGSAVSIMVLIMAFTRMRACLFDDYVNGGNDVRKQGCLATQSSDIHGIHLQCSFLECVQSIPLQCSFLECVQLERHKLYVQFIYNKFVYIIIAMLSFMVCCICTRPGHFTL